MGPGRRLEVPGHDHQLEQRALAHAQQVEVAVFPAVQKVADLLAAGVFPTAPDPGQRATGDAHAQHVEQLLGELEHLRRQPLQAEIELLEGVLNPAGDLLGTGYTFQQHRDHGAQERQITATQHHETAGRRAAGATAEARAQPGGSQEGAGTQADFQDAAPRQRGCFSQARVHCYCYPVGGGFSGRTASGSISGSICRRAGRSTSPRSGAVSPARLWLC